jgi:hypothetical protein
MSRYYEFSSSNYLFLNVINEKLHNNELLFILVSSFGPAKHQAFHTRSVLSVVR